MGLCFCCLRGETFNMERLNDEIGWNQLRYDIRTYTAQNERNRRGGEAGKVPDGYKYIGDRCFLNNGKVHEVVLPEECRIIGKQAFEGCQFQKVVAFPEGLLEIKKRAFAVNHRLRKVVFPKSLEKLGAQAYQECNKLHRVEFPNNSRCTVISEAAFDSCVNLISVKLPCRTQVIERRAFYRCKELKEINLPAAVREIGEEAFYFCAMEELELPPNLNVIGDSAFFRCKQLREVYIPESVKIIGRWAFHGCSRLERVEILHDPEEIGPWIINKSCTLVCRKGSKVDHYARKYGFKCEYVEEMMERKEG